MYWNSVSYHRICSAMVVVCALATVGCSSRPGRVSGVEIDVVQVCDQLLSDLDEDGNGLLNLEELQAQPALASVFGEYDGDRDGQISRSELQSNFERVFDRKYGLLSVVCRVTRKGHPVAGATVRFVPAPFLLEAIPVAEGVTKSDGGVILSINPDDLPPKAPKVGGLTRPGMYLVEVTHPSLQIPKRFNDETELGREVSQKTIGGPMALELNF